MLPLRSLLVLPLLFSACALTDPAPAPPVPAPRASAPISSTPIPSAPAPAVTATPVIASQYVLFDRAAYDAKLGKEPMVLFFHAPWCPSCRALDAVLQDATLTGGVPVYKVDYDTTRDLKDRYDIRTQHTLVAIGADGQVRDVAVGPSTAAEVQALVDAARR